MEGEFFELDLSRFEIDKLITKLNAIDSGIANTQALGSIDTSNAVITLDVSKGNYAATTLHEVTHFIAVNAPEQFKRFKNEVIRFEINKGRLASDLNKYAEMYSNIDNINELTEEMAANAAEALLKSDDFIVDLMSDKDFAQSMAQESPSIAKKIFNKLQELIDAIRDFLKHSEVEHDIARAISKDAQTLETIRGLWLDAFKTAIHNRAVQHENKNSSEESTDNKSSGIKFSKMETYPYDMQTVIREYIDSVDNNIKDFAEYAVQHKDQGWRTIELSSISNKETEKIKNLVNIDVTGYKRTANINTFVHIEKRHGTNGEQDHSLADINDVARMNYVLENYDDIKISRYQNGNIVYSTEFFNSDGSHAIVIQYSKKINGTYYVAEAVPDSKAKNLRVTSAYINKEGEYHEPNAEAPRVTSETHHELSPSINNISQSSENVNTQNQKNSTGVKNSLPENDSEYYSDSANKEYSAFVKKFFGTTNNWNETGYLMKDGSRLDFSDKNNGGEADTRIVDHRDVSEALYDIEYYIEEGRIKESDIPKPAFVDYITGLDNLQTMIDFMRRGNIRIAPEGNAINLSVKPTEAQYEQLSDFIATKKGEITLDIDDEQGETVASVEYPKYTSTEKILSDIENYFRNGTVPQVSVVSEFHKKFSITENMTEDERYNELKDKTISLAHPDMSKVADIDIESYRTLSAKNAKKPIRQLAKMLGIHNVNYSNSSIDFEFGFSKGSLDSSIHHQKDYGGDYADYAKMLTCLDELVNNSELIEVHKDYKGNEYLQNTYVLLSAYAEDGYIYPIQLEVKQYKEGQTNGLYLSVILTKIKEPAVMKEEHIKISTPLVADFNINITQLFAYVNPSDAKFLKYVPDQFLSDQQIDAKRQAQKVDYEKYGRYKELFEPSVRFSIPERTDGEYETLMHENEQLQEQVKALRAEMELTQGHKVKPDVVAKLARKLKKEYSSNIDIDKLTKQLEDLFNYIASDDAIADLAHEVMYAIAGDIIDNSQKLNTELRDEYKEIRDLIQHTTIFVNDGMKSEIEYLYGNYNDFRKSMFGQMKLSTKNGFDKKGINIDSFYQDLMSAAPEWFDDVTEQEMLPRIADFLKATDAYMENPYEQDTEQYISDLAQEIFNQYFETPEVKTFADKQQEKLQQVINASRKQIAKLREQNKEQFDKRLAKLKEEYDTKIDSLKAENKEKLKEQRLAQKAKYQDMAKRKAERLRDNAEKRKRRDSIKKNAKEILRWLDNPTDKKHVPELLRNTVAEFLTSIDFVSDTQEKNAANGEPSKEYNFWQAAAERLYRVISEETKVTEEKENGETAYNFSDLTVELDPDFLSRLNEIIESSKQYKRISDMDNASLKELDILIRSLRHAITSVNMLYTNQITENVAELAGMTNDELYSRELKKTHNKLMSKLDKVLNVSMLIPLDYFERMGKSGAKNTLITFSKILLIM